MALGNDRGLASAPAVMVGAVAAMASVVSVWQLYQYQQTTKKQKNKRFSKKIKSSLQWAIWLSSFRPKKSSFVWLTNVRVPIANLRNNSHGQEISNESEYVDHEGLVYCHLQWRLDDGTMGQVQVIPLSKIGSQDLVDDSISHVSVSMRVDGQGCIVIPCFVDAHTHMVKTQTVPRNVNQSGTMSEALAVEAKDQITWATPHNRIHRFMDFAARCALHHGTRAMRTHLDGLFSDVVDPDVLEAVYDAFDLVRDTYDPDLIVQGVANLFLPLWLEEPRATEHANRAARHQNVVLGAYVPSICSEQEHRDAVRALDALFQHAHRLGGLDVDLHIDESNNPNSRGLVSLIESLGKARTVVNYQGKVVLGHCCALSLQNPQERQRICQELAQLQNVFVVSNPFTNLGLQDRKGSSPPFTSMEIPADEPRTPQWRGLTAMQELRAAGVTVASASDNVRDHWYPYGDFDMLTVWASGQALGHLDTAPSEGHWADICTDAPAEAMGISSFNSDGSGSGGLATGSRADLILFPSARRMSELFARPQVDRIVIRRGRVQGNTTLPDFQELDDLM